MVFAKKRKEKKTLKKLNVDWKYKVLKILLGENNNGTFLPKKKAFKCQLFNFNHASCTKKYEVTRILFSIIYLIYEHGMSYIKGYTNKYSKIFEQKGRQNIKYKNHTSTTD
jgi:hypothetical protein